MTGKSSARHTAVAVVGHPSSTSLSHAFASAAIDVLIDHNYKVAVHNLYADGFDPVQPTNEANNICSTDELVERYCAEIAVADLILVFHPNWWGQPPAMVKGWIDRVLRLGVAYTYGEMEAFDSIPIGLLQARAAVIINTSNTPAQRETEVFGDPLDAIWRRCVFPLCGVRDVARKVFGPVCGSTEVSRAAWINEIRTLVEHTIQLESTLES